MSHAQTFDSMLEILLYVTFKNSAATVFDLQNNVIELSTQNINRRLLGLKRQGYLTSRRAEGSRTTKFYAATSKTKELFGVKV